MSDNPHMCNDHPHLAVFDTEETTDDVSTIAENHRQTARGRFEQQGHLLPTYVFVLSAGGKRRMRVLMPNDKAVDDKEGLRRVLGKLREHLRPVAVIHQFEALHSDKPEAVEWTEQHGSLDTFEGAEECLCSALETAQGHHVWFAKITMVEGRKTLGPWELLDKPQPTNPGLFARRIEA